MPPDGIYTSPEPVFEQAEDYSITDFIFRILRPKLHKFGDKAWMCDANTGAKVLFREIEPLSKTVASGLSRLGFGSGDRLYYVTYETAVLYLVHVAVWRLNGAVRGCYQQESVEEYARQIKDTGARFVLVDADTCGRLQQAAKMVDWPVQFITFGDLALDGATTVDALMEDDGSAFPENVKVDRMSDVVIIPNTSGSTGMPKGAMHTHYNLIANNASMRRNMEEMTWTFMTPMSNYAIGCLMFSIHSIVHSTTIVHLGKFEKEKYFDYILKFKPDNVLMYPFVASWFARHQNLDTCDLSFLKAISTGGSVLDAKTAELLAEKLPQVTIIQVYGMTESLNISCTLIDFNPDEYKGKKVLCVENEGEMCVSAGKLLPGVEARILDANSGECLGPNKTGHVLIRSPYLMKGYVAINSDASSRSDIDADGWLHTGDIGFFDVNGNIFIKERISLLFKYFMFIVSPSEIEAVLQTHPDVLEAGVVGVPHAESTNVARAFVVLKADRRCTEQKLCQHVAQRLPTYKHLHGGIQFLDKLPESRGNKLDRPALKRIAMQTAQN